MAAMLGYKQNHFRFIHGKPASVEGECEYGVLEEESEEENEEEEVEVDIFNMESVMLGARDQLTQKAAYMRLLKKSKKPKDSMVNEI